MAPESGRSSGVEHNLAKVGVEGSNPFARSSRRALIARHFFTVESLSRLSAVLQGYTRSRKRGATESTNQTPLLDSLNSAPSSTMRFAATRSRIGAPRRCPTRVAVSMSGERWTWWRSNAPVLREFGCRLRTVQSAACRSSRPRPPATRGRDPHGRARRAPKRRWPIPMHRASALLLRARGATNRAGVSRASVSWVWRSMRRGIDGRRHSCA